MIGWRSEPGRVLATDHRVALRYPTPADREEFLALVKSSRKLHHPWVDPPRDARSFDVYTSRNARSLDLIRRSGFRCEGLSTRYLKVGGRWRDHERWALLAEEWQPRAVKPRRRSR